MASPLRRCSVALCLLSLLLGMPGCSGPRPILYPNAKTQAVGDEGAARDIEACRDVAERAGAEAGSGQAGRAAGRTAVGAGAGAAGGAVGGAISGGSVGMGAAIGAASGAIYGLFSWLFGWMFTPDMPNQAYVNVVNRCLSEQGYEVSGWQ